MNTKIREKEGERTGQKNGGKIIFKYSYQKNKKCVGPRNTGDRMKQERYEKMRNDRKGEKERGRTTKNIYNIWLQVQITSTTERRCIDV